MKIYRIKNYEDLSIKGKRALNATWAEQIIINKLAKYGRSINFGATNGYEAIEETEKAVKLKIDGIFKFVAGGKEIIKSEDWDIWMPKSALVAVK